MGCNTYFEERHMKRTILSFLVVLTSINSFGEDYIECKREPASFRQFCTIDESVTSNNLVISAEAATGLDIDVLPVLESAQLSLNDLNSAGMMRLDLPGLNPAASADIYFDYRTECLESDLWHDNIHLAVKDNSGVSQNLSKVRFGNNSYNVGLIASTTFKPWSIEKVDSEIKISSQLHLNNSDDDSAIPIAKQRIPHYCQMNVTNFELTYQELPLSYDIGNLYVQASTTIALMTRASVLHTHMIDSQAGSICNVYDLGNRLKDIELVWDFDDLSPFSQDAIEAGMSKAADVGAIVVSGGDYWSYFKGEFQTIGKNASCGSIYGGVYEVDTAPFMRGGTVINHQGYNNAIQHAEAKDNLYQLMAGAWAVSNAAKAAISDYAQEEWLTSSVIIDQL